MSVFGKKKEGGGGERELWRKPCERTCCSTTEKRETCLTGRGGEKKAGARNWGGKEWFFRERKEKALHATKKGEKRTRTPRSLSQKSGKQTSVWTGRNKTPHNATRFVR